MDDSDTAAIQMAVALETASHRLAKVLGIESTDTMRDFDKLAWFMVGEGSSTFSVFRMLHRRFGARDTRWLIRQAAELSNSNWKIILRRRLNHEFVDKGEFNRRWRRERENDRLGVAFYLRMQAGLNKQEAIRQVTRELNLPFTARTFNDRLKEFRLQARRRGFVDPDDAGFIGIFSPRTPKVLLREITRRGRPRKRAL